MSKETLMSFKLELDLHTAFKDAAKASHRPASQILRELMREYIERQNYADYLEIKVGAARSSLREGLGISNADVEDEFAARRRALLERVNGPHT